MTFPQVTVDERGYHREQVDALVARARAQYEDPSLALMNSSILQASQFDLVPEGYLPAAVDAAIARIADRFDDVEIELQISSGHTRRVMNELEGLKNEIGPIIAKGIVHAFSRQRQGYDSRQVRKLVDRVIENRDDLANIDTFELRSMPLGSAKKGLNRLEVDLFFEKVIAAAKRQRALR